MNIPVPRDAEGAVLFQALEDPDFKLKELKKLQENYERVKKELEAQKSLTHEYNN